MGDLQRAFEKQSAETPIAGVTIEFSQISLSDIRELAKKNIAAPGLPAISMVEAVRSTNDQSGTPHIAPESPAKCVPNQDAICISARYGAMTVPPMLRDSLVLSGGLQSQTKWSLSEQDTWVAGGQLAGLTLSQICRPSAASGLGLGVYTGLALIRSCNDIDSLRKDGLTLGNSAALLSDATMLTGSVLRISRAGPRWLAPTLMVGALAGRVVLDSLPK